MKTPSLARTGGVIAWVLLTLLLVLVAHEVLAVWFMPYDDEGYVQYSLRTVAEGAPLFTTTFSQYGPFFYLLHIPLAKLGYPFSSDAARVCATIYWVGTSLACGLITWRLSGSRVASWIGTVVTFLGLQMMRNEPGHPGGLLALLSAWAVYSGVCALLTDRSRRFGGIQGIAAAMLFWTKINIGVLHAAAALTLTKFDRLRPSTHHLLRTGIALLAVTGLTAKLINDPAIQQQWLLFACGVLGLVFCWPRETPLRAGARPLLVAFTGAFLAVTAICTGGAIAAGTHLADLIHGALVAPFAHPSVYAHVPKWHAAALPNALLGIVLAATWRFSSAKVASVSLMVAKIAGCAPIVIAVVSQKTLALHTAAFQFSVPFAWALAVPLLSENNKLHVARHWVAWAFVWHWLQAYPVAGTQTAWGSLLAFPLAALAIHDLANLVRPRLVLFAALAASVTGAAVFWSEHTQQTRAFAPLALPGASTLRIEPDRALMYQLLVQNARRNGDMLFTFPGMLSFNLWSGLPPPTFANTTHWFSLLDEARQLEIVHSLETARLPLVIVWQGHVDYLAKRRLIPQSPLLEYLLHHFEPAVGVRDFEIWKRRDNRFLPFSVAYLVSRQEGLRLCAVTQSDRLPAALQFVDLSSGRILETWTRTDDWDSLPLPPDLQFPAPNTTPTANLWTIPLPPDYKPFNQVVEIRAADADGTIMERMRFGASIYNPALTYAPQAQSN